MGDVEGGEANLATSGARKSPITPRRISAWMTPYAAGCRSETWLPRWCSKRGVITSTTSPTRRSTSSMK